MTSDSNRKHNEHNKLRTYRKLKRKHVREEYLTMFTNPIVRSSVSKLRLSSHKLIIEKGRHLRLKLEERICPKCNLNKIEDEFHRIMVCPAYSKV